MSTKIITLNPLSSPERIRIHKHSDNSVTVTMLGDSSHGDRLFNLAPKDWEKFKELIRDV